MKRIILSVMMLAMLSMALIPAAVPASANPAEQVSASANLISYTFDFEKTVKPWLPYAYKLPVNEHTLVLKHEPNNNGYAALTTTGGDMTWMLNSFNLGPLPGNKGVDFKVTFQARNVEGSGNVVPIYYIGSTKPAITDFNKIGPPLTNKWQNYAIEKHVIGSNLLVAVGYMTDKANWAAIDNVTVKWEYR